MGQQTEGGLRTTCGMADMYYLESVTIAWSETFRSPSGKLQERIR
jgi:hypothetical protein